MLFTELPFVDRLHAAADEGFYAVECLFPYEVPAERFASQLRASNLTLALFNMPAGNWEAGDRGLAALPDRVDEFRTGVFAALDYARITGCTRLHLMAGLVGMAQRDSARVTLIDNIRFAADIVGQSGIEILLEPINSRIDMPGYFYDRTDAVLAVIDDCGRSNVKLQFDIYHMQIMQGDLARTIRQLLPIIGHIQIADNPGRNEPGTGEINYGWILDELDRLSYQGYVGCEYQPLTQTVAGLGWARQYLENRGSA
jgi:hydroxypyruvate isomerase